jgi:phenylpropionate dioxygenase-like ring-hydroxylating dioxygenase large terminal subunit
VQCPYHGWTYDGQTGACRRIPNLGAREELPAYSVPSFAVVENQGWIQIWTGGAESGAAAPRPFASTPEWRRGQQLVVLPHSAFVGCLLDAPGVVLDLGGIEIIHGHRFGDPVLRDGSVSTEFAADRAAQIKRRKRTPADYPLSLQVKVLAANGMAAVDLLDDQERVLLSAVVASVPVTGEVTAVRWRTVAHFSGNRLGFATRSHVEPLGLARRETVGARLWQRARHDEQPAASVAA